MRNTILTYLLVSISLALTGQTKDTWTSFWNRDTTLIGFKDKHGIVKIKPTFKGFTSANKFDDIIAVTEEKNEVWESYYLTKKGRIVGRDSLYLFDNGADCESEVFIRFRDKRTHKVGMFDKNGDIAIPAAYNNLTRVKNGFMVARKDAYWDEKRRSEIFEFPWTGGKEVLIDTKNSIIIDSFNNNDNINFYSLRVSANPSRDPIRRNFKTVNGQYYSFIDFDKEFNAWLKSSLLNNFSKERLLNATYNKITFWKEPNGWISEAKNSFIDRNFELIKTKLLKLNAKDCDYAIFDEGLNPYTYETDEYKDFFNNCREPKDWIYPIKNIVISYKDEKDLLQDHFEFLRTANGYKLISITVREGALK